MKNKLHILLQQGLRGCFGAACVLWLGHAPAAPLTFSTEPAVLANTALGTELGSAVVGVWRDGRAVYAFQQNGDVGGGTDTGLLTEQAQQLY